MIPTFVLFCKSRIYNHLLCARLRDQISPPGGYVRGGLQMRTDIDIDPAGDVWTMNNWQDVDSCCANPPEALSTRCGGQGVVIFYGMAKPVRAPQIGPARADFRRQVAPAGQRSSRSCS